MATVAVLVRELEQHSLRLYRDAMFSRLPATGFELHPFAENAPVPAGCDLVWDPGLGMRKVPSCLLDATQPLVVTVLGLRSFALSPHLLALDAAGIRVEEKLKREARSGWHRLKPKLAAAITISQACAEDIRQHLGIPREQIHPIHLAVDRGLFAPGTNVGFSARGAGQRRTQNFSFIRQHS